MDEFTLRLLDAYQKNFPLDEQPFLTIARELGVDENRVLQRLAELKAAGIISRIGPVFDHAKAGASTLAAVSVPKKDEAAIAAIINAFPCVNHNYAREHDYNLWFVVTAPDETKLHDNIRAIEKACNCPVLMLPMEKAFHIDLGFSLRERATC